jgi:RNA polymerase sigma-70 factor (ECF subfamily)
MDYEIFKSTVYARASAIESLESHPEDLYLAWACGNQIAGAIEQFEREYMSKALPAIRRFDRSSDFRNEVAQRVRTRLFLGDDRKIFTYSGSGPLLAWLRIALTRAALDMLDTAKRTKPLGEAMADRFLRDSATPERKLIEATYFESIRAAIETSLTQLSSRERSVLRLYFVDGTNIDQIATIYRVHRATVARWIVSLRERLTAEAQQIVGRTHHLSKSEILSVWRMAREQIQVSVIRILAADNTEPGR